MSGYGQGRLEQAEADHFHVRNGRDTPPMFIKSPVIFDKAVEKS